MFPASSGSLQPLVELLAATLAENERQAKLLDELRQENAALRQENPALKQEIVALKQENAALRQENLALQDRLNRDATNSNQPPSQDSPFQKNQTPAASAGPESKGSAPAAAKKSRPYHKGARQQLQTPDEVIPCSPGPCSCGCPNCVNVRVRWIHQWIELPKRLKRVVQFHVQEGRCARCGKKLKGRVPTGHETGFGPGLTASIATWNAGMTVSRRKSLKRAAAATLPHYEAIGRAVRASPVNHADETTWRQHGPPGKQLLRLRVLVNRRVALGLAQNVDARIAACGRRGLKDLLRLVRMSPAETSVGERRAFLARFCRYVGLYRELSGRAGAFVRRLEREFPALVTFLLAAGVEPTNNLAERSLRHAVVLRKISLGTSSEWGRRWIERALSLYQTCRLQKRSFFEVLGEALEAAWGNVAPDLGWIEAIEAQYAPAADTQATTP